MGLIGQEVSPEPRDRDPGRRCATPTGCGGRRRCTARAASSRRSARPRSIFYKYEGVSPGGLAQAQHRRPAGLRERAGRDQASSSTETGAGQWGSSLAFACSLFGLECEVFMVGSSYDQKPYRRSMMQTWGATVHRSPSRPHRVRAARRPSHPTGSLGIAISEAVEVAAQDPDMQLRARLGAQPRAAAPDRDRPGGDRAARAGGARCPDVIVGCVGGGSNFAGLVFPFLRDAAQRERSRYRRRRAGGLPDADPRRLRATTSATPSG